MAILIYAIIYIYASLWCLVLWVTVFSKFLLHVKKRHNFIEMKHACKTDQMQ